MGAIMSRRLLSKIMKAEKPLSMLGSEGYSADPSDLLGSYPRLFYVEAGSILVVNCFDDNIIESTILDLAENKDGTISGAILSSESMFRESLKFDGTDDYINFDHVSAFDITSQITVEAWLRFSGTSGDQQIAGKDSWFLKLDDSAYYYFSVAGNKALTTMGVNTTDWHYVSGTYDGSNIKLYVDGALQSTVAWTGSISTDVNALRIGATNTPSNYFNGYIAGVRISNRAKSANEIEDYYYGQKGL